MSRAAKSLVVIVLAVALAGAAGYFLTRHSEEQTPSASGTLTAAPAAGGGHVRGPASAQITLVEWGDYQCPTCGAYYPVVEEMMRRFPTQLKLEFHHYPIVSLHPNAMAAATAAEAAGVQNHYWEMHYQLYLNQESWSRVTDPQPLFITYASQIGIDVNQFMQALRAPETQQKILQDVMKAQAAGIDETPTFFIGNEKRTPPMTLDEFTSWIQSHLSK